MGRPPADGVSGGWPRDSRSRTSLIRAVRNLFPPRVEAQIKAVACELPACRGLPLSRFSASDIRDVLLEEEIVGAISRSSVSRLLAADALRPWRHRSWIFPRDPDFARKAGRVLGLYEGVWEGKALGPNDYVISADEKTSIQARGRRHPTRPPQPGEQMRVEHEYKRCGAVVYLAALDVLSGKVIGHVASKSGIASFDRLVGLAMGQAPYAGAERVFWIVDNGSSHRGLRSIVRLQSKYPNLTLVHGPVHASWLNQIEIYFSIVQRKVLTPNEFPSLKVLHERLLAFQKHYEAIATPFAWKLTRQDLARLTQKLGPKTDIGLFAHVA